MPEFMFLMHADTTAGNAQDGWEDYFNRLRKQGAFKGGSAIGDGQCVRKDGKSPPIAKHLTGYIRVTAASLTDAKQFLAGNPVYEAGGTVEIRELPRS